MAAVVASAPHLHHEPMDRFLKGPVIRQAMPIYFEGYSEFTQSLKEEIPRVMREPHGYDSVSVLLSYWEDITTRGWCSGSRISCIGCVCTSIERREERGARAKYRVPR
jgi:hypothetical protein